MMDNSDEFSDEDLGRPIISFLCLREREEFRDFINNQTKDRPQPVNFTEDLDSRTMDYLDSQEEETPESIIDEVNRQSLTARKRWREIVDDIELTVNHVGTFDSVIETYTHILELHSRHLISLESWNIKALLFCRKPLLIKELFDKGLIESSSKDHLPCLFNQDRFALPYFRFFFRCKHLGHILYSFVILIYISPISGSYDLISVVTKLAELVNSGSLTIHTLNSRPEIALKAIVHACILNGVFTNTSLAEFLANTRGLTNSRHVIFDDSSELEDSDDRDTSMSDSDYDDERVGLEQAIEEHQQRRNLNRDIQNGNPPVDNTIGTKIGIKSEGIYPQSLKNLARIQIKKSMIDYSLKNVMKLNNLPATLKDFVLFRKEITLGVNNFNRV